MAEVIETVIGKVEDWVECWSDTTLTPRRFRGWGEKNRRLSAFEFFVGNNLLAYILLTAVSIVFFFVFFHQRLLEHTEAKNLSEILEAQAALFGVFVLLNFAFVFFSSLIAFAVARPMGSTSSLTSNVNAFLQLSSVEPLAICGQAILVLTETNTTLQGLKWIEILGAVLLSIPRLWALVMAYFALSQVHRLPRKKQNILYCVGFLPSYLVLNTLILTLVTMLESLVFVKNFD